MPQPSSAGGEAPARDSEAKRLKTAEKAAIQTHPQNQQPMDQRSEAMKIATLLRNTQLSLDLKSQPLLFISPFYQLRIVLVSYYNEPDLLAGLLLTHLDLFEKLDFNHPSQASDNHARKYFITALGSMGARADKIPFILNLIIALFKQANFRIESERNLLICLIQDLPKNSILDPDCRNLRHRSDALLASAKASGDELCLTIVEAKIAEAYGTASYKNRPNPFALIRYSDLIPRADAVHIAEHLKELATSNAAYHFMMIQERLKKDYQEPKDLANLMLEKLDCFKKTILNNPRHAHQNSAAAHFIRILNSLGKTNHGTSFTLAFMIELFKATQFRTAKEVNLLVCLIQALPHEIITEIDHSPEGDATLLTYAEQSKSHVCIEAIKAKLSRLNSGFYGYLANPALAHSSHTSAQSANQFHGMITENESDEAGLTRALP